MVEKSRPKSSDVAAALLANALVLAVLFFAALLYASDPDLYYRSVQEDEALEWASFWSFLFAAAVFGSSAFRRRGAAARSTWFGLGLSLFCFFVAMEEISWGQRLLGYRPPAYFLEHNFQQELNVHNVVAKRYRKLVLGGIILGYGVLLALLGRVGALRKLLRRAAVVAPPVELAPGFLAIFVTYVWYPWTHTGEWVEFMLGLGFLFAAVAQARSVRGEAPGPELAGTATTLLLCWLAVVGLGTGTAAAWRVQAAAHPESVAAAQVEVEALRRDFAEGRLRTKCGLHRRLYTYVEKYGENDLLRGEFSGLTARGLPEARAQFLFDPWNSPYWIRDTCSKDRKRRAIFVYSFGPNRRRDTGAWGIHGDDVGAFIRRESSSAEPEAEPTEELDPDARP